MSELELKTADISRRDFLVGTAAVAGGIALASAGVTLPQAKAFADTTLADGTYSVCANLYISKTIVLIHKDAYFTNPTDPNEEETEDELPDSPVTYNNATMVVSGGVPTVTVPLENECFMLLSASDGDTVTVQSYTTKTAKYQDTDGNTLQRIDNITFQLANTSGSYTLGDCQEYGAYQNPPFPMSLLVPGYLTWTATLSVDFDSAVAQ